MNDKNFNNYKVNQSDLADAIRYFLGTDFLHDSTKRENKEKPNVDMLLDQYNDYMTLYKMFGDKEYKLTADEIMNKLKELH